MPDVLSGARTDLHQNLGGHTATIASQWDGFSMQIYCRLFKWGRLEVEWCWKQGQHSHFSTPCKNSGKDGRDFSSFTYDRISRIHLIAIFCAAAERGGLTKVQHLLRPSDITTWAAKSCFRNARVTLKNNWHVFLAHSVYLELQFCREIIQVMIRSFIYLVHNWRSPNIVGSETAAKWVSWHKLSEWHLRKK